MFQYIVHIYRLGRECKNCMKSEKSTIKNAAVTFCSIRMWKDNSE